MPTLAPATRCRMAVGAVVKALALDGIGNNVVVASFARDDTDRQYPAVVVTPGLTETYGKGGAGYDLVGYPVRVAVFDRRDSFDQASQDVYDGWRHRIERAFSSAYLTAVPESSHCTVEPFAILEEEKPAYQLFQSGLVVRCWCRIAVTPVA